MVVHDIHLNQLRKNNLICYGSRCVREFCGAFRKKAIKPNNVGDGFGVYVDQLNTDDKLLAV